MTLAVAVPSCGLPGLRCGAKLLDPVVLPTLPWWRFHVLFRASVLHGTVRCERSSALDFPGAVPVPVGPALAARSGCLSGESATGERYRVSDGMLITTVGRLYGENFLNFPEFGSGPCGLALATNCGSLRGECTIGERCRVLVEVGTCGRMNA